MFLALTNVSLVSSYGLVALRVTGWERTICRGTTPHRVASGDKLDKHTSSSIIAQLAAPHEPDGQTKQNDSAIIVTLFLRASATGRPPLKTMRQNGGILTRPHARIAWFYLVDFVFCRSRDSRVTAFVSLAAHGCIVLISPPGAVCLHHFVTSASSGAMQRASSLLLVSVTYLTLWFQKGYHS